MNNQPAYTDQTFLGFLFFKGAIITFWLAVFGTVFYLPGVIEYLFPLTKTLHVYAWTDSISPESIQRFSAKTGINIRLNYFQSNEELFAKLRISKGDGYDLIVTSDYMVELLRREKLLQKIDHSLIKNYHLLDKRVLGQYFDPQNHYSLPLGWTVHGFGISRKFFGDALDGHSPLLSWALVFKDPERFPQDSGGKFPAYKISVPDDGREMLFFASLYLFGKTRKLSDKELDAARALLLKQKGWVESYTSDKLEYELVSGTIPLIIGPASYVRKIMRHSEHLDFVLPKEGGLLSIENLAIPQGTKKRAYVHAFIDFLLSEDIVALNHEAYGYNPVNVHAYKHVPPHVLNNKAFFPDAAMLKKIDLLYNELELRKIEDLWLAIKSA